MIIKVEIDEFSQLFCQSRYHLHVGVFQATKDQYPLNLNTQIQILPLNRTNCPLSYQFPFHLLLYRHHPQVSLTNRSS